MTGKKIGFGSLEPCSVNGAFDQSQLQTDTLN